MIKYRTLIIFILLLSISSAVVVYQVNKNYWDIIYDFLLYDHIEYNGISYYSIEDQFNSPSNEYSDEKIIVGIGPISGLISELITVMIVEIVAITKQIISIFFVLLSEFIIPPPF